MTTGVFAGSFDPITRGHGAIVKKALKVVDRLYVVISVNPDKKGYFPEKKRDGLVKSALMTELSSDEFSRVTVLIAPPGLTVDLCDRLGATVLVRGLRNTTDYEYEATMEQYNTDLAPHITTVYLRTPPGLSHISSSGIKHMVGKPNWPARIEKYIYPSALTAFVAAQFIEDQCYTKIAP